MHVDDEVFLDDEDLRNEYVQKDGGLVYAGWSSRHGPSPNYWNFGQVCSICYVCLKLPISHLLILPIIIYYYGLHKVFCHNNSI